MQSAVSPTLACYVICMKSGCEHQQIELVESALVAPSVDTMSQASPFAADESQRLLGGDDDDPEE